MQVEDGPQLAPLSRETVAAEIRKACRQARTDSDAAIGELDALAHMIATAGLAAGDSTLSIGARTAVRLLAAGLTATALDVMRHQVDKQPFRATVSGGGVFAWLPGYDDPRVGADDAIYEISDRIVLRSAVEEVRWHGDTIEVGGVAHLSHLRARPDDVVTLTLAGPGGGSEHVRAERVRRPDRVATDGDNLTRLAWSGFRARIPGDLIFAATSWTFGAAVAQGDLTRSVPSAPPTAALKDLLPFDLPGDVGRRVRIQGGGSITLLSDQTSIPARSNG